MYVCFVYVRDPIQNMVLRNQISRSRLVTGELQSKLTSNMWAPSFIELLSEMSLCAPLSIDLISLFLGSGYRVETEKGNYVGNRMAGWYGYFLWLVWWLPWVALKRTVGRAGHPSGGVMLVKPWEWTVTMWERSCEVRSSCDQVDTSDLSFTLWLTVTKKTKTENSRFTFYLLT